MKATLTVKLLQHLASKKQNKGFTLIELLVVVIIIGILAAIALPNLLNQANKAKQSEARQNVSAVNRGQSTFRLTNPRFADSFDLLALGNLTGATGEDSETEHYVFSLNDPGVDTTFVEASPKDEAVKGYKGATSRYTNAANLSVSNTAMCEAEKPGTDSFSTLEVGAPSVDNPDGTCTGGVLAGQDAPLN